jgi:hypothetical protein
MEAAGLPQAPSDAPEAPSAPPASSGAIPEATASAGAELDGGERDEQGRYLSREAATYRRRLRETEAERDRLATRLDELQRAEVERLAGAAGMAVPGDLWSTGTQLENLRDDAGRIEGETVSALVGDILQSRPTWRASAGDFGIGRGAGARAPRAPKVGLSALLKP